MLYPDNSLSWHSAAFVVKWIESSLQYSSLGILRSDTIDCIQDVKYGRKGTLSYLGLVSWFETLSNDIDVLAYLIQKLPITSNIGQYVDHHDAVIDVTRH